MKRVVMRKIYIWLDGNEIGGCEVAIIPPESETLRSESEIDHLLTRDEV
jgi:hypothetical protein